MNRTANRPGSQHMARFPNFGLIATVCRFPRAADGDRPRSGLRRTANRPGSQRVARHEEVGLLRDASPCSRAADGDRPRSEGMGSSSQCMRMERFGNTA
jgi:hypothetical protein